MTTLSPPVPRALQELLKDYPDRLDALAVVLRDAPAQAKGNPPFDVAVWALEDTLGRFISDARAERDAAQAGGDEQALRRAEAKLDAMFEARSKSGGLKNLSELSDYFDGKREAQA